MKWTDIKIKLPEQTGAHSVSIARQMTHGKHVFTYVAHYDAEANKWFKYNPFVSNSVEEEITDKILGWIEHSSTYLGEM